MLQKHNFTAKDITDSKTRSLSLQRLILKAQLRAEQTIGSEWFISDRSGLDPLVYAKQYVGESEARELIEAAEWVELRQHMRQSAVVVCEAGTSWLSDDGVRLMPTNKEEWMTFHQTFCTFLEESAIKYTVLSNSVLSLDDRVGFVVHYWEGKTGTKSEER